MSIELIRNQRDKNSGELNATPPNGKCPIGKFTACRSIIFIIIIIQDHSLTDDGLTVVAILSLIRFFNRF